MVKWHQSGQSRSKHVFCKAACHGIKNPKRVTAKQCAQEVAVCRKLLKEHKEDSSCLRQEHLGYRYKLASDLRNPKQYVWIEEIIKQEEQEDDWQKIK